MRSAFGSVAKGKIRVQFSVIERASQPRLFWALVALIAAAGIVVLARAAWALFFKANRAILTPADARACRRPTSALCRINKRKPPPLRNER